MERRYFGIKFRKYSTAFFTILFLGIVSQIYSAPQRWAYNAASAVTYARNNVNVAYGTRSSENPFGKFENQCTNFVSQSILAGLTNMLTLKDVFARRSYFAADRGYSQAW